MTEPHIFNGPEYEPNRDNERLGKQIDRIRNLMLDGQWRTLIEIEEATGDPVASISAQLRHLRKERFGAYVIERRNRGDEDRALFEYRLLPPDPEKAPPKRRSLGVIVREQAHEIDRLKRELDAAYAEIRKLTKPAPRPVATTTVAPDQMSLF